MDYKRIIKININFISVFILAFVFFVVGILSWIHISVWFGIFCIGAGILTSWIIVKILRRMKSEKIVTYTEGFSIVNLLQKKLVFNWDTITQAGIIQGGEYDGFVFVYSEPEDLFIQLPPLFYNFEDFIQELNSHIKVEPTILSEGETVENYLKRTVKKSEKTN